MTGFGKFLVATIVSFFLMIGALGSAYPTFLIALALLVWVIFIWSTSSGSSKQRRDREEQIRLLNSIIRSKGKF
jgi:hypothetical protein